MKSIDHRDYLDINSSLVERLWKYKNRNEIKYPLLHIIIYGIVQTLHKTDFGTLHTISPSFPDGQFPHEALGLKIDGCR